jgi:glutamine synthetase
VGFETEFVLLKKTRPIIPVNNKGYCLASAFLAGDKETQVLEEMAEAIMASKIELHMYHAELAPGQVSRNDTVYWQNNTNTHRTSTRL